MTIWRFGRVSWKCHHGTLVFFAPSNWPPVACSALPVMSSPIAAPRFWALCAPSASRASIPAFSGANVLLGEQGLYRYNMLQSKGHWFPGTFATEEALAKVDASKAPMDGSGGDVAGDAPSLVQTLPTDGSYLCAPAALPATWA